MSDISSDLSSFILHVYKNKVCTYIHDAHLVQNCCKEFKFLQGSPIIDVNYHSNVIKSFFECLRIWRKMFDFGEKKLGLAN